MTAMEMVQKATAAVASILTTQAEAHWLDPASQFVDVREADEIADHGRIAGSIHVPRGQLEFWADPANGSFRPELDPTATTVVYDMAGRRAALAARTLLDLGYERVTYLEGGLAAWIHAGLPVAGLAPWHVATHR